MIERLVPVGPDRLARIRCTERADGDFSVSRPDADLAPLRRTVSDRPWTWLRQVHGDVVVTVARPGGEAGREADAAVTAVTGAVLAVHTADCAPVVLSDDRAVAVVHAGWRGIVSGVVPAALNALRAVGAGPVRALVGPVVRPGHYEFGAADLEDVVAVVGPSARATTTAGTPALDLAAAVSAALREGGVDHVDDLGLDTSAPRWFSYRCRGEQQRMATAVVLEPAGATAP